LSARALDDLAAVGEVPELVHDMEGPLFVVGDLPCPEPEDLAVVEQDDAVFDGDAGGFCGQLRATPCLLDQVGDELIVRLELANLVGRAMQSFLSIPR
jgi:hypothetical protein